MSIQEEITQRLKLIEHQHSVVILFAVESGSRAWGFESADSDYDIRFIYKHAVNWYLSIEKKRDVIEYPVDRVFDFSGWDLQKALKLFSKSNPPLLEWLRSPILYLEQGSFRKDLLALEKKYFSQRACILHYLHMASGNYREYLKTETVKTKKYLYVLRPLFACEWIRKNGTPPPMEFEKLVNETLDISPVRNQVFDLVSRKRKSEELGEGPSIPDLNRYIEETLHFYAGYVSSLQKNMIEIEHLDRIFLTTIGIDETMDNSLLK